MFDRCLAYSALGVTNSTPRGCPQLLQGRFNLCSRQVFEGTSATVSLAATLILVGLLTPRDLGLECSPLGVHRRRESSCCRAGQHWVGCRAKLPSVLVLAVPGRHAAP